nr:hypothetical protein GCM10025730_53440 [Promicromonospora thailandica]
MLAPREISRATSSSRGVASWFDLNGTTVPLADGEMSAEAVGPLLASTGLWVVVPFVLGLLRVSRIELR